MRLLVALSVLFALPALASRPTLENRDAKGYAYDLDCAAATKQQRTARANSTVELDATCRLTVRGAGTAKLQNGSRCVIQHAVLACR